MKSCGRNYSFITLTEICADSLWCCQVKRMGEQRFLTSRKRKWQCGRPEVAVRRTGIGQRQRASFAQRNTRWPYLGDRNWEESGQTCGYKRWDEANSNLKVWAFVFFPFILFSFDNILRTNNTLLLSGDSFEFGTAYGNDNTDFDNDNGDHNNYDGTPLWWKWILSKRTTMQYLFSWRCALRVIFHIEISHLVFAKYDEL